MDVSDQELFDSATTGNRPSAAEQVSVEEVQTPAEPATPAVGRDEAGRFAAKTETEAEQAPVGEVAAQTETEPKEPPPHRFREVSERARAAEARAQQLEQLLLQMSQGRQLEQPKAEPPAKREIWDDPDGWVDERIGTVNEKLAQFVEMNSRRNAERDHGTEKVSAAFSALDGAIVRGELDGATVKQQLAQSMDPYGDIMKWHAKHSVMSEIGDDPAAYEKKIIERYLASQQQAQPATPAQQTGGSVIKLPPSLNRATSAASNSAPGTGELSDAALFNQATSQKRR
jgi:hypothetical protein